MSLTACPSQPQRWPMARRRPCHQSIYRPSPSHEGRGGGGEALGGPDVMATACTVGLMSHFFPSMGPQRSRGCDRWPSCDGEAGPNRWSGVVSRRAAATTDTARPVGHRAPRRVTSAGIKPEHDDIWQAHQQLTRSGRVGLHGSSQSRDLGRNRHRQDPPVPHPQPHPPPASKHLTDQTTPPRIRSTPLVAKWPVGSGLFGNQRAISASSMSVPQRRTASSIPDASSRDRVLDQVVTHQGLDLLGLRGQLGEHRLGRGSLHLGAEAAGAAVPRASPPSP